MIVSLVPKSGIAESGGLFTFKPLSSACLSEKLAQGLAPQLGSELLSSSVSLLMGRGKNGRFLF